MKTILLLGSLLASSSCFYFMGHADGYRAGQLDPIAAPNSNCYTPDDQAKGVDVSHMRPCLTVE